MTPRHRCNRRRWTETAASKARGARRWAKTAASEARSPRRLVVCAIAVFALCAIGCAREVEHVAVPVPVRAQTVEVAGGGSGHRYSATIRPDVQVDLAFKVSGYIE